MQILITLRKMFNYEYNYVKMIKLIINFPCSQTVTPLLNKDEGIRTLLWTFIKSFQVQCTVQ